MEEESDKNLEKFMTAFEEYQAILNETSPQFLDSKESIQQIYSNRLSEIDAFLEMKNGLIQQEGVFHQQMKGNN